jgi:hypothetical protein
MTRVQRLKKFKKKPAIPCNNTPNLRQPNKAEAREALWNRRLGVLTMKYLADVKKLHDILNAEIKGHRVDHTEALLLVRRLRTECPDIASTLAAISERMASKSVTQNA